MAESAQPSLLKGMNSGTNEDGSLVELEFHRVNGTVARIQLPTNRLSSVFLRLQETAAMAHAQQRKVSGGSDPRLMSPIYPMTVTNLKGGTSQGKPILSLEINKTIVVDLSLEDIQVADLIEWLEQVRQMANSPTPKPH